MTADAGHERSEYRIIYPLAVRPLLRSGVETFQVVDVSEHGVRLIDAGTVNCEMGDRLSGELPLAHGPLVPVRGTVVRRFPDGFAVAFDEDAHIILALIIGEQRHLRELFPDWR